MSEYPSTEYKAGYETGYRDALYESKKIAMEIASWLDGQVREHAERDIEVLFQRLKQQVIPKAAENLDIEPPDYEPPDPVSWKKY